MNKLSKLRVFFTLNVSIIFLVNIIINKGSTVVLGLLIVYLSKLLRYTTGCLVPIVPTRHIQKKLDKQLRAKCGWG